MGEKEKILEKSFSYEGIFLVKEVLNVIKQFAKDKGYSFEEASHTESVKKSGRNINLKQNLKKKVSDYIKVKTTIELDFSELNDKLVENKKYQVGKVKFTFEGALETDYEKRWESKPSFWLLRYFLEKYVYDSHLVGVKSETSSDVDYLIKTIKAYLNMLN
ncbi:MAG: hypothetical protein Q8Q04_03215 [archaeon]|nr:hypothetical protein [archaeon]